MTKKILVLLEEIKKELVPSKAYEEQLQQTANNFIEQLRKKGLQANIGGSLAKRTITKKEGKQDIDIFITYKTEKETTTLGTTLKNMKLPGILCEVHGSRDYYKINEKKAILELVPIVEQKKVGEGKNTTDYSPLHVTYIQQQLKKNPQLREDIILAKTFCKAQGFYGAESYIHGFSGYALELLITHYKGFLPFIKNIRKTIIIDPEQHYKNKHELQRTMNSAKQQSPIILVDPTYKERNATAGLNKETYNNFLHVTKEFLKKPTKEYFKKPLLNKTYIKEKAKGNLFIELTITTDREEGNIAGAKCKKFFDYTIKHLRKQQQNIIAQHFEYEGKGKTAKGYLALQTKKIIEQQGPPISMKEAGKKYQEQHPNAKKKHGHYWTTKNVNVKKLLDEANEKGKEIGAWSKNINPSKQHQKDKPKKK